MQKNLNLKRIPPSQHSNSFNPSQEAVRVEFCLRQVNDNEPYRKPKFQDVVLKTSSEINIQTLKQYVSSKFKEPKVEANDVDLFVIVNEKPYVLKNKERICDLMKQNLLSEEKLTNEWPAYFGLWN